jgi:hypothetical protein
MQSEHENGVFAFPLRFAQQPRTTAPRMLVCTITLQRVLARNKLCKAVSQSCGRQRVADSDAARPSSRHGLRLLKLHFRVS